MSQDSIDITAAFEEMNTRQALQLSASTQWTLDWQYEQTLDAMKEYTKNKNTKPSFLKEELPKPSCPPIVWSDKWDVLRSHKPKPRTLFKGKSYNTQKLFFSSSRSPHDH